MELYEWLNRAMNGNKIRLGTDGECITVRRICQARQTIGWIDSPYYVSDRYMKRLIECVLQNG